MQILLGIHNILRWLILGAAVFTLFRMVRGLVGKLAWSDVDRRASLVFTIFIDIQLLLGLILYFIYSPLVKAFFANLGAALQNETLRYWGIEHLGLMAAAVVFAHLGSAVGKRDIPDAERFKRSAILFSLAFLFLILGIPWMRPLLPVF